LENILKSDSKFQPLAVPTLGCLYY